MKKFPNRGISLILIFLLSMTLTCKDYGLLPHYDWGIVRLQNQTDHSGILVRLRELNKATTTDSVGHFSFSVVEGGKYTLEAKYPFFSIEIKNVLVDQGKLVDFIEMELKQCIQLWISPRETTVSLSNLSDSSFFSVRGFTQYRTNISQTPVRVEISLEPRELWALEPQEVAWPVVPNPDNRPEFCYENYGWLGSNDAITRLSQVFQPGETTFVSNSNSAPLMRDCFKQGTYLIFSAPNDQTNYPEFFDATFFWPDTSMTIQAFNPPNRTLLRKKKLFQPAIIHITN